MEVAIIVAIAGIAGFIVILISQHNRKKEELSQQPHQPAHK